MAMGLISSGIDSVRVFELPIGVWADGAIAAGPRVCLVRWRSAWVDKAHQVYINGEYAGTTIDCEQRQMVVATPNCFDRAVRVEIFAVEPEEADIDFSEELAGDSGDSGRVKLSLLRSQRLAAGARFKVYYNGGAGEIDYEQAIGEGLVWVSRQDKAGFGLSRFGEGDFGYEWAGGVCISYLIPVRYTLSSIYYSQPFAFYRRGLCSFTERPPRYCSACSRPIYSLPLRGIPSVFREAARAGVYRYSAMSPLRTSRRKCRPPAAHGVR